MQGLFVGDGGTLGDSLLLVCFVHMHTTHNTHKHTYTLLYCCIYIQYIYIYTTHGLLFGAMFGATVGEGDGKMEGPRDLVQYTQKHTP